MLLVSPKRAALAVGSSCKNNDGSDNPVLQELLRLITPRVEAALEVASLTRGTYRETFNSPVKWAFPYRAPVYLSNGFMTASAPVFTGLSVYDDVPVSSFHRDYGVGSLAPRSFDDSTFTIQYVSGFELPVPHPTSPVTDPTLGDYVPPDVNYRVAIGVPDWIVLIAVNMLSKVYRVRPGIMIPKDVSLMALLDGLQSELKMSIMGRYMRPRYNLQPATLIEQIVEP